MADYRSTIKAFFQAAHKRHAEFLKDRRTPVQPALPFLNRTHQHAAQVIAALVQETHESLLILCGQLSRRAHSIARLQSLFRRHPNATVRIIVEGTREGPIFEDGLVDWSRLTNSALIDLHIDVLANRIGPIALDGNESPGKIAVRIMPTRSKIHLVISDDFAIRIEDDDEFGKAIVNAQDPDTAAVFVAQFEDIWVNSTPLQFANRARVAA
jgi:hypothetical protein